MSRVDNDKKLIKDAFCCRVQTERFGISSLFLINFSWLLNMTNNDFNEIFTQEALDNMFPKDRADKFFDALYGDVSEGAYDICLKFDGSNKDSLHFEFHLKERPGKCLACSVTYGLPQVFTRHPIINVKGIVQGIDQLLDGRAKCGDWRLGRTHEVSRTLHVVPLAIKIE